MKKTYTGRTLGGGRMTVECPDWCVTDHAFWDDPADDMFHCTEPIELELPKDRAGYRPASRWPLLTAEMRQHSTTPGPAGVSVWLLPQDGHTDNSVEVDARGLDAFIEQLDAVRARLVEARGLLARIDAESRQPAA
ncbi:hypothetical protein RM844_31765 [Streptomyces sp. DSM 44915]|uniref:Uncharacterized protein n=1 Tax=Streptomyces chisholmiae TaxID=3075540 RepID=A0ABU2K0R6_9ACTN|nr:hypothetical protein [Streptomyces sp. DSM 44915]MDT0270856.1 hypothetical protein [Streptomyces sp. DSM 44915]